MIRLLFEKQKVYFFITIENKKIMYWDHLQGELWGGPLQYLPPDPNIKMKIQMSRNKIPADWINLFYIPKDEIDEFNNAKDDKELRDLVVRDCRNHNCRLIKEENS